jgi:zinc protease
MILFLASLCLLSAPPAPPDLNVDFYKLDNGLRVVLHRDPTTPRVSVVVAYHVGAKNERPGRTGFAHFFEHMMFRGTPHVPNYDIPLQEAGVQTNAFTSEDMTVYHETVPTSYLDRALYLEAERMGFLPAGLDQKKFDAEREVVKNERLQNYENVPYGLADEAVLANLYPAGAPYSWSVIGSMKDLNAATLDDLKRFFAEYYHPGNAVICLSGDFEPAEAKRLVAKYFAPLKPGPAKRPVNFPEAPAQTKQVTLKDRVQFPRVYLAWPTVSSNHADAPALEMLSSILTDGDASRLMRALVRDAQSAQEVDATQDGREIAGNFSIVATATPGKKIEDVEQQIMQELEKIKQTPPTKNEIDRALVKFEKQTYSAVTSLLGRGVMLAIHTAQKNDPLYYKKRFAQQFEVTPADVQRVAATYLKPERLSLYVQPMGPGEKQTPAFLAGPAPTSEPEADIPDRLPAEDALWKTMPPPSTLTEFTPPKIVKKKLSNGIETWIVPWKTLPVAHVRVQIPVGTADDPAGKTGLAQLTATLLTQGTKNLDAVALAEEFDLLGAQQSAAVGSDATQVSVDVLARNLKPAMKLVGDMLNTPRHEQSDFDREKSLLIAALQQGPDDPSWIARRAYRGLIHGPEHPYGKPADGEESTVKSLTLDDVKKFHQSMFGSKSAKIVLVGDVDPDQAAAALEEALASWKTEGAAPAPRPVPAGMKGPDVVYFVDKPGAVQSIIRIGRLWGKRTDPDYELLEIGNRILGADFLSRLNQNLRERNGFTYGASTGFRFLRDRSTWQAGSDVRADATGAALKEMIKEIDGVRSNAPYTPSEIEINRAALLRAFPESFETPMGIAGELGDIVEFNLPDDEWTTHQQKLAAATAADIQQAANRLVDPESRLIVVVGDRRMVEPLLKAAGFRDIRPVTPEGRAAK